MDNIKALELAIDYEKSVRASEKWEDFIERSLRGSDYYLGIQTFTDEIKQKLMAEGKPALVFNEILPIINYLTSMERDNRKETKIVERRGGYASVAQLMTELKKHVMDMCEGDFVKSDVFLNGIKAVVGWFKIEIDYTRDPITGQLIITSRPPLSVMADPTAMTYDLNDIKSGAKFIIDTEYIPRDRLKAMFPDKSKDIDEAVSKDIFERGKGTTDIVDYLLDSTNSARPNDDEIIFDTDLYNRWRCRVSTAWIRELVPRTLICDKRNWELRWLDPAKKEEGIQIEQAKQLANEHPQVFKIKEKEPMPLLRKMMRVGEVELEFDEKPFNGSSFFPLIPFSPFGEAQYEMGVVDNLIGPQDELNKRMTNMTHILNSQANGGMVVNELQKGYKEELRAYGSSPNYIVERNKCGGFFQKIEPSQLSQGHEILQSISKNYLEEISGVTGSSRGYEPNRQESGRLFREKVKQSMATNQIIFDRFDHTTKIMTYTLLSILRHTETYTEQEIGYLIEDKDLVNNDLLDAARGQLMQQHPPPVNPMERGPELFAELSPENQAKITDKYKQSILRYKQEIDMKAIEMGKKELFKQLSAYRTGKYSVTIIQSPNSPTTQIANFYELEALKDMMPPEILAPYLIKATGIPNTDKEEIVDKLNQMTGMAPA